MSVPQDSRINLHARSNSVLTDYISLDDNLPDEQLPLDYTSADWQRAFYQTFTRTKAIKQPTIKIQQKSNLDVNLNSINLELKEESFYTSKRKQLK